MQVQSQGSNDCCRYALIITGAIFVLVGIALIIWGVITLLFDGLIWLIAGVAAAVGGSICCCIFCCMQPSSSVVIVQHAHPHASGMPMHTGQFQQQSLQQQPAASSQVLHLFYSLDRLRLSCLEM